MQLKRLLKSFLLSSVFAVAGGSALHAQNSPSNPTSHNRTVLNNSTSSLDAEGDRLADNNSKYANIVIDADTGDVITGSEITRKLHPASTTKLMTAYLVFEALENGTLTMNQKLTVSKRAANIEPSELGLVANSTVSVKDALQGMLIKSANDAAIVLATGVGGTEANFIKMMNAKAKELGMMDSQFVNANGLPYDINHGPGKASAGSKQSSVTVADMAVLMQALVKDFPQYYAYLGQQSFEYKGTTVRGHNRIMMPADGQYYEYVDGGKTGYVRMAGCNLVCSAVKDNKRLIAVVFGMPNGITRSADIKRILENAYDILASRPSQAIKKDSLLLPAGIQPLQIKLMPVYLQPNYAMPRVPEKLPMPKKFPEPKRR